MTTIKLDPGAALLLDALHGAGHAAYAVGGCVRDSLLGLDPHDWDLCTSARPEQVMALFEMCIRDRPIIICVYGLHLLLSVFWKCIEQLLSQQLETGQEF